MCAMSTIRSGLSKTPTQLADWQVPIALPDNSEAIRRNLKRPVPSGFAFIALSRVRRPFPCLPTADESDNSKFIWICIFVPLTVMRAPWIQSRFDPQAKVFFGYGVLRMGTEIKFSLKHKWVRVSMVVCILFVENTNFV